MSRILDLSSMYLGLRKHEVLTLRLLALGQGSKNKVPRVRDLAPVPTATMIVES